MINNVVLFNKTTLNILLTTSLISPVSTYRVHNIDAAQGPITRFSTAKYYDVCFFKKSKFVQ